LFFEVIVVVGSMVELAGGFVILTRVAGAVAEGSTRSAVGAYAVQRFQSGWDRKRCHGLGSAVSQLKDTCHSARTATPTCRSSAAERVWWCRSDALLAAWESLPALRWL